MRHLLLALALAGCGPSAPPPPEREPEPVTSGAEDDPLADIAGRPPTAREQEAIAALMRVAERTRSLTFARPVPFRIQGRDVITQFVRDQIDAEELERARVFYVAIGLLAPDLDIHELLIRVLGEQIVGYYDPERSLMVIREDVAEQLRPGRGQRQLGEAEMVIVHELVHALQDQRLGLGDRYEEERTIDGENAFASLVEGDATLAMIGHMASRMGQPLSALTRNAGMLRMLIRQNPDAIQGQEIEQAPPIVRLPLMSRYLDGMILCATLHGQRGWPGVDGLHARPPATTEQVLHPDRYLAGELSDEVTLPPLPELAAAGLTPHEEDSLGELESGIYLGQGVDGAERDESAAEGWGGDRIRVYLREDGSTAVVWWTSWDDEGEATEAELSARRVADAAPPEARARQRVERRGRAVLILRDLEPDLHGPVQSAFAAFADALPAAPPRDATPAAP
ncbi:MAG: hypothetical protein VYE22_22075 [Myxococcota bacterium]|nr:hypothetical protein [Myxococcota bacterium]